MKEIIKKYRAIPLGLLLTFMLVKFSSAIDLISIDPEDHVVNFLVFSFYAVFISLAIHKYLKQGGNLYKVGIGFLVVLALVFSVGYYTNQIKDNPLTIILVITFWLFLFYLILPEFFKKYRYLIVGLYAAASIYFVSVRMFSPSFEQYESNYKMLALSLFMVPVPLLISIWIYEQWKWFKTLKAEKAEAELALLRNQVNPHFFFNTLNNLYSLTVNKSERAPEVIVKLSDMMRYTIYEGKNDRVNLDDEIQYLQKYIELHEIRYQKEVDIRFEYPSESDIKIVPLLFIILLENAFKHGVESLRKNAFIQMELSVDDNNVKFLITNNFDEERQYEKEGIGLKNLRKRLQLLYPDKHRLKLQKEDGVYTAELEIEIV